MYGFFSKEQVSSLDASPSGRPLSCASCGLYRDVMNPRIEPYGDFRRRVLVVGEAPGEEEDKRGKPWQGKVGRRLQRAFRELGWDLFLDCVSVNAINCRPTDSRGNNREPSDYEIACCRARVLKAIRERSPSLILALGNAAIRSLIGSRWKKDLGGITKWRGWAIPDHDLGSWIFCTFHPSFVERAEGVEVETIWMQDLKEAFRTAGWPLPAHTDARSCVEIIDDLWVLDRIRSGSVVAIDYETTGLKPYAEGHQVVCAAVADSEDHTYAFMIPDDPDKLAPFLRLLADPETRKIAHNMKFEEMWSCIFFHQPVQGWYWDTELAAHVLDNRPGITGLKFQTYVNFGIVDYSSDISPYLRATDGGKSGNAFNKVRDLVWTSDGRRRLMTYCGMDALFTLRLANIQMRQMGATDGCIPEER